MGKVQPTAVGCSGPLSGCGSGRYTEMRLESGIDQVYDPVPGATSRECHLIVEVVGENAIGHDLDCARR